MNTGLINIHCIFTLISTSYFLNYYSFQLKLLNENWMFIVKIDTSYTNLFISSSWDEVGIQGRLLFKNIFWTLKSAVSILQRLLIKSGWRWHAYGTLDEGIQIKFFTYLRGCSKSFSVLLYSYTHGLSLTYV